MSLPLEVDIGALEGVEELAPILVVGGLLDPGPGSNGDAVFAPEIPKAAT